MLKIGIVRRRRRPKMIKRIQRTPRPTARKAAQIQTKINPGRIARSIAKRRANMMLINFEKSFAISKF